MKTLFQYKREFGCNQPPTDRKLQSAAVCFVGWSWKLLKDVEAYHNTKRAKDMEAKKKPKGANRRVLFVSSATCCEDIIEDAC